MRSAPGDDIDVMWKHQAMLATACSKFGITLYANAATRAEVAAASPNPTARRTLGPLRHG